MNEDTIQGNWKQFRGEMKRIWGNITDDEFDKVEGQRDKLAGLIQERYGRSREQAEKEVDGFFNPKS
ncbi:MAG: CsbD family protein [Burkholderiales bacterium]|nr:CsbD family protein [Burkholderiales bacterium]